MCCCYKWLYFTHYLLRICFGLQPTICICKTVDWVWEFSIHRRKFHLLSWALERTKPENSLINQVPCILVNMSRMTSLAPSIEHCSAISLVQHYIILLHAYKKSSATNSITNLSKPSLQIQPHTILSQIH